MIMQILELMEESFDNTVVKKDIKDMRYSIISGVGIADSLKQVEIYSDKYQKMA